ESIIVQKVFRPISSPRNLIEKRAHHPLGVVEELARSRSRPAQTVPAADFAQPFSSGVTGRNLRPQVSLPLLRRTYVVQEQGKDIRLHFAGPHDLYRRNAQSLLVNFAAKPHRTRKGTSHVGVMGA